MLSRRPLYTHNRMAARIDGHTQPRTLKRGINLLGPKRSRLFHELPPVGRADLATKTTRFHHTGGKQDMDMGVMDAAIVMNGEVHHEPLPRVVRRE